MKVSGVLFGLLFGLIFSGVGAYIAFETAVPTLQSWHTMKQWQSTTASLLNISGQDNATLARYRYTIDGISYENNRVYVAKFNDNIGSYHERKYNELWKLKNNRQPVTIWYNPNNPAESVIDRSMRWGLFILMTCFCSIFIFVGIAVAYAVISSKPADKEKKIALTQLRKEWDKKCNDPGYQDSFLEFVQQRNSEPENIESKQENAWLQKKEWQNNHIHSDAKSSMWSLWFFAIIWNAISSPVLFFALEDELKKGNYAVLIALLFPLVGLFLIKKAWDATQEWNRFGVIGLEMDPFPGSIGGHVGGVLHVKNVDAFDAKYKVELECVYTYMSGSGDNRSRKENIKWFESGFARVAPTMDGIEIRFRFDVPDDLPESDVEQTGDYSFWRLKVSAEIPGIDLEREYNIPVYRTAAGSSYVQHNISAQVEEINKEKAEELRSDFAQGDLLNTALARSLRFKDRDNKLSFYYPMFRNKVLTVFALFFGIAFSFATYSINDSFGSGGMMSIVMLVFSIPFALVGLLASLAAIYLPFNTLSISLAERKIKAIRSLFFIPIQRNIISIDDIKEMEIKSSGSTGQGAKQVKHYKIIVHTTDNHKITIAEGIDGMELAKQFKEFIYERLSMTH